MRFFVCPAIGRSEKSVIARADCAKIIQEGKEMRESKFKNYNDLPLTLTAPEVGEVLGISSMRIGARILVPKDKFLAWIDAQTGVVD